MQVGLNDWGMIINNTTTYKQVAALDLKTVEVHHKPNTNYLEVTHRKKDFVATITTPQVRKIVLRGRVGLPRKVPILEQREQRAKQRAVGGNNGWVWSAHYNKRISQCRIETSR